MDLTAFITILWDKITGGFVFAIGAFIFVWLLKRNIPKWFHQWQEIEEKRHNNKMIEMKAQMMTRKEI